jgi:hypothetical protein
VFFVRWSANLNHPEAVQLGMVAVKARKERPDEDAYGSRNNGRYRVNHPKMLC